MQEEDFESKAFEHLICNLQLLSVRFLFCHCLVAIKVLIVGNGGVGKSSLIRRFCTGNFTEAYKKTIGEYF